MGKTSKEHLENLGEVLTRLEIAGTRLKEQKCAFYCQKLNTWIIKSLLKVNYVPTHTKVKAITKAPAPINTSELKAILGLINYYGKYLNNLATVLAPFTSFCRKLPVDYGRKNGKPHLKKSRNY